MARLAHLLTLVSLAVVLVLAASSAQQAQPGVTMVRRVGLTRIVGVAPDGRATDTLYRSSAVHVFDLAVSPSGKYLAALEGMDSGGVTNRLVVLDPSASRVQVVNRDVRTYVWCCGGLRIAMLAGTWAEAGGFVPTGAYLYDPAIGSEVRLDVPDVVAVTWAAFDQALYFRVAGKGQPYTIIRYDPRTAGWEPTTYRDLRFSPSGRYYLHYYPDPSLGAPGPHVFERETGSEVPLPDPALGAVEDWVFGEGDLLRLKRARYPQRRGMLRGPEVIEGYTIYDVARRAVAATIRDSIAADVVATPGTLVLASGGVLKLARRLDDVAR
jgi:hypothetical protein